MEIRVLGPTAIVGGAEIGRRKLRALLALLAAEVGRNIPTDQLIDGLWGERPPRTAAKTLRTYILQLRALLPAGSVITEPGGYRLTLDPNAVDAVRFTDLVSAASQQLANDPQAADHTYTTALSLWQGVPYADVEEGDLIAPRRSRLEETRLLALEGRAEARLALGQTREIVGELRDLVAQHPLRERLWELLMLALYRSGRQGEALSTYQGARHRLASELGIEPGRTLQQLEQQILNQDPQLLTQTPQGPALKAREPVPSRVSDGVGQKPLHGQDLRRERKFATALFADVVGSTALAERIDPELVQEITTRVFDRLGGVIDRYGGIIDSYLGDGILAVFGVPVAHEDDPERAVRAALELQATMAALNGELRREGKPELAIRIGSEAGDVLVDPYRPDRHVSGDVVNLAARLQSAAHPGSVLVGPVVHGATHRVIDYQPLSEIEVKGKAEPVMAWQPLRVASKVRGERPGLGLQARLFGRQEEMGLLRQLPEG